MKKILLFLWNTLIITSKRISKKFYLLKDKIYVAFKKAPGVMSSKGTIEYIINNGCSVTRFGDGEIKLVCGRDILFQEATQEISNRLKEVLSSDDRNLLVCLPAAFSEEQRSILSDSCAKYWINHLARYRNKWYRFIKENKTYGNAFISRHYMNLKNKDTGCADYFRLVRQLWDNKDIIIVEGEKSRLGMGNDLFDNAKSVRRILGPSSQCFSKYDELLEETKSHGTEPLYILALGPSATVMAYDLAMSGYRAIDMGNIDTEYEWFLAGAKEKQPVKNKLVYEAMRGTVGEAEDPKYLSQIIAKIL